MMEEGLLQLLELADLLHILEVDKEHYYFHLLSVYIPAPTGCVFPPVCPGGI